MKLHIEADLEWCSKSNSSDALIAVEALTRLKRIGECAVMIKTDPLWAQSMAYAEILQLCGVEKP